MKILVGIKHVPDTETKIKIASDGVSLEPSAVNKWIISPFDEYALEQGLQLRDAEGGEVIAVCCGPGGAQATLRQALAMGADRAVLVEDERFDRADGLTRARALAAVAKSAEAELVLVGKYGVGGDEAQTGPMTAELLGWPHATGLVGLEIADGKFTARREIEGAVEIQEGRLPAVLGCDKGLNEPRYPSLKGIMQAKKKPLDVKSPADVGLDPDALDAGRKLVWEAMEMPPERPPGRLVDGEPAAAARELVRILHEEEKVI